MFSIAEIGSRIKSVFKTEAKARVVHLKKKPENFDDAIKLFVDLHNENKYEYRAIETATLNHLIEQEFNKELEEEKDPVQAAENIFKRLSPELSEKLIKASELNGTAKDFYFDDDWKGFIHGSIGCHLSLVLSDMAALHMPDSDKKPDIGVFKTYKPTPKDDKTADLN